MKSANYDIRGAIFIQDFELQNVRNKEQWQKFIVGIVLENAKDCDIAVNGKTFLEKGTTLEQLLIEADLER